MAPNLSPRSSLPSQKSPAFSISSASSTTTIPTAPGARPDGDRGHGVRDGGDPFHTPIGAGLRSRAACLPTAVRFQRQQGLSTTALLKTADLQPKEQGQPETLDYRVFLVNGGGRKVSPWHDVPLRAGDGVFHFAVEIPKESSESSAKMEVATDEAFTPIKQDTKKGNLRYYP